jgi:predicted RNA binding protein YcfA (HicA-like mRNA interferase family)
MNTKHKLLSKMLLRPAQVRFNEACKAAELLGFMHKGGAGSHVTFAKAAEPVLLNFQNRNGFIPNYQARQLAMMIDKYGENNDTLSD